LLREGEPPPQAVGEPRRGAPLLERKNQIKRKSLGTRIGPSGSGSFLIPIEIIFDPNGNHRSDSFWDRDYDPVRSKFWPFQGAPMATRFEGQRRLVDTTTGEVIDANVVIKTVGDAGFHKIWLHEILELVDEVGNAKMRVLMWLLSQADAQNQVWATKREIAAACDVGTATVQRLMSALQAANVIAETRRSVWRLNPEVIFKGDHNKRMAVLVKYRDEKQGDLFEEPADEPRKAA
jgi:hypothetical protein